MTDTDLDADLKTEITWRPAAWQEYKAILNHCHRVGAYFGQQHADPMRASVMHCLDSMLVPGPTTVFRDGELCLYVVTRHITMGMIFHADNIPTMASKLEVDSEDILSIADCPRTGEWSLHS